MVCTIAGSRPPAGLIRVVKRQFAGGLVYEAFSMSATNKAQLSLVERLDLERKCSDAFQIEFFDGVGLLWFRGRQCIDRSGLSRRRY